MITEHHQEMRTSFAYCPRPTWRTNLAYQLGREACRLPVYAFAAFAMGGGLAVLLDGVLRLMGRG